MTIEEICNKYIKVKATGILALHQHPKQDWAFKVVSGKESDVCNGCFLEKYYPLRLHYTCAAQQREDGKNVQFKKISKTMTREEMKELLPIIQEWVEGKTLEYYNTDTGEWEVVTKTIFINPNKYRIKHEPKHRPFKNQEECWNEMHKHPDFGWVIAKDSKIMYHIYVIGIGYVLMDNMSISFPETFAEYEFTDGTPFGIKEE